MKVQRRKSEVPLPLSTCSCLTPFLRAHTTKSLSTFQILTDEFINKLLYISIMVQRNGVFYPIKFILEVFLTKLLTSFSCISQTCFYISACKPKNLFHTSDSATVSSPFTFLKNSSFFTCLSPTPAHPISQPRYFGLTVKCRETNSECVEFMSGLAASALFRTGWATPRREHPLASIGLWKFCTRTVPLSR